MVNSTNTTHPSDDPTIGRDPRPRTPLVKAWLWIATVPAFFFGAFAAAQGIYALTGHDPSMGATPPLWADLAAGVPALAILLIPCIAGAVNGRRAVREGERAGLLPAAVGVLLGVGAVVLVVVNVAG